MIPLVDLKLQYHNIKIEIDEAIQTVLNEAAFYKGRHVREFEENFRDYLGVNHCVGVANCTDALQLALHAVGVKPGSEIITAANTFIATSEAISAVGAEPAFVDIDLTTYNIDLHKIESKITEHTAAIIPVHLNGRAIDMDEILRIARKHHLYVIEDCAQACGAEWKGRRVGTIGDIGCFSFYPGKNLGAYGDGGALVTDNEEYARYLRMAADHGREEKYVHEFEGMSSRLDGIQAAILNVKLKYLDKWNECRYDNAWIYNNNLNDAEGIISPSFPPPSKRESHVFHVFLVRVKNRDMVFRLMKGAGIEVGMHYPNILPCQPAYSRQGYRNEFQEFPNATRVAEECLSLPMYPELSGKQIKYIASTLKEIVGKNEE